MTTPRRPVDCSGCARFSANAESGETGFCWLKKRDVAADGRCGFGIPIKVSSGRTHRRRTS